jgi:hypothetical protein
MTELSPVEGRTSKVTLSRDFADASLNQKGHGFESPAGNLPYFQDRLPLRVVDH